MGSTDNALLAGAREAIAAVTSSNSTAPLMNGRGLPVIPAHAARTRSRPTLRTRPPAIPKPTPALFRAVPHGREGNTMGATRTHRPSLGRSIRSRVMVCYGLCAIAETEVHAGQVERASGTVTAIREGLHEINLLSDNDLRVASIRDLKQMMAELDRWTWDIGRLLCRASV